MPGELPVANGLVRHARQLVALDAEDCEQLFVPLARVEIEQACRRRDGEAHRHVAFLQQVRVEIFRERHEARRRAKDAGLLLCEPSELRGPVARVDLRAGSGVHRLRVDTSQQPVGRVGGPCVAPAEHGRQRTAVRVERNEAVPEARRSRGVDVVGAHLGDRPTNELDDAVGVVLTGVLPSRGLPLLGRGVEDPRADRRRADVESEDARHGA